MSQAAGQANRPKATGGMAGHDHRRHGRLSSTLLQALHTRVRPRASPMMRDTRKMARKTKKSSLAIPTAVPAIPPKPKSAATRAITRNIIAQPNTVTSPFLRSLTAPRQRLRHIGSEYHARDQCEACGVLRIACRRVVPDTSSAAPRTIYIGHGRLISQDGVSQHFFPCETGSKSCFVLYMGTAVSSACQALSHSCAQDPCQRLSAVRKGPVKDQYSILYNIFFFQIETQNT
jgi:hypothetical protein